MSVQKSKEISKKTLKKHVRTSVGFLHRFFSILASILLPRWFKISDSFRVFSDFWQDSPNMASRAPQRRPKTAPRASQERPRPPQDCPKNISERPNSVPGAAESDLRAQKHRKIHKTIQKHGEITKNAQQPAGTQKTMQKIVQIN